MVNGSTLFLFVGLDKIAQSTGYQLDVTMEQIPKISNDSGFFSDHISKIGTWSISSDSLLLYNGFSYEDLFDLYVNRAKVFLSIGDENGQTFLGFALIESISANATFENVPAVSVSFTGVGQLSISDPTCDKYIIDELLEIIVDESGNFLIYDGSVICTRFIIDELFETIIDQDNNLLTYT